MKLIYTLLSIISLFIFSKHAQADHIIGGEINYAIKEISEKKIIYQLTVRLIRDEGCRNCMTLGDELDINIIEMDAVKEADIASKSLRLKCFLTSRSVAGLQDKPRCLVNDPGIYFMAYEYQTTVQLPKNKHGYLILHTACCRVFGISNLEKYSGFAYHTIIPGVLQDHGPILDNSPVFDNEIALICRDNKFKLRIGATDPDGDSLVYAFANSSENLGYYPGAHPNRRIQHTLINHKAAFPFDHPLGLKSTIDAKNGEISGLSPESGRYLINVAVRSYRNGQFLNETQKDLIITISECDFPSAILQDQYTVCTPGETLLKNEHESPLNQSFRWDIIDPDKDNLEVYRDEALSFRKKKAGQYYVRLVINESKACSDTAFTKVLVSSVDANIKPITTNQDSPTLTLNDVSIYKNGQCQKRTWMLANDSLLTIFKDSSQMLTIPMSDSLYERVLLITTNEHACTDTAVFKLKTGMQKKKQQKTNPEADDWMVCFDVNSYNLSAASKKILNQFIQRVLTNNIRSIRIEGHTDNSGNNNINQPLSENRANQVAEYLKQHGLSHIQIETTGFSDSTPIAENETAEGKKRNRRAEIKPVIE
ncbi:MAG: OmpA family protein [Ferruginibacter sp.]